jgi:hypothetical protein
MSSPNHPKFSSEERYRQNDLPPVGVVMVDAGTPFSSTFR